jgi:HEAT repeat protein
MAFRIERRAHHAAAPVSATLALLLGVPICRAQDVAALAGQLSARSVSARIEAVWALTKSKDPAAVGPLIAALRDKHPVVRMWAAQGLGDFKDPRAIGPLATVLEDKDIGAGSAAATALGLMADKGGLDPLLAALKDPSWKIRQRAVNALGMVERPEVAEALLSSLEDREPWVRAAAIAALGRQNRSSGPAPFLRALADPDGHVRYSVGQVVAQIDEAWAHTALHDASRRRDQDVVWGAYRFFLKEPEADATSLLVEILQRRGSREMAEDFLNARDATLKRAAEEWAKKNNLTIFLRVKP